MKQFDLSSWLKTFDTFFQAASCAVPQNNSFDLVGTENSCWKFLVNEKGCVTIETALPGDIHLVDPMDGSVYTVPHERDPYGTTILRYLPIRDYPLYLVFGELPVESEESK